MNFNNYSNKEFKESDLPHNRKEVFFDTLKVRFLLYVEIGFVLFLFLLPFLGVNLYGKLLIASFLEEHGMTEEAISESQQMKTIITLFYIPTFMIFSIGLSGVMKVIRQLIWGEGVVFKDDFISGIKQNYIPFLSTFLLFGLVYTFDTFIASLKLEYEFIVYIPYGVTFVFIIPLFMYILTQSVLYSNKYTTYFKNSVYFFIKTVPVSLLFTLILLILIYPVNSSYLPYLWLQYTIISISIILLLPFFLSAKMLYDFSIYDKYINIKDYPEYVDKGINRIK